MRVFHDLSHLPSFRNAVLTIGSFDGVHHGHQKIIEQVRQLARNTEGESVVITFHPHPRQVVYPQDDSLRLLTSIEEKIRLLEQYGIDNLVVIPFTVEFSQQSADEYILRFLVDRFHPRYIVIGYDHRFGLGRQGDVNYLKWHGKSQGYEVVTIEKQEVESIAVSSTKIREALERADIDAANRLLNHHYTLTGTVVPGEKIGTRIGFPTANIQISQKHKLIPPNGVYAAFVVYDGQRYGGMLYIGNRPTVRQSDKRTIEVNIFGFNREIYGEPLTVELVAYVRGDLKLESLDALRQQIEQDRERIQHLLQVHEELEEKKKRSLTTPSVAVVILNYNGRDYLQRFLPSVVSGSYPGLDVYVADNGSVDGSLDFLEKEYPGVRRIDLHGNHGFAQGYNLALRQVMADYYILLNSDVEVTPGWIEPVIELLERQPAVAACQPKIRSFQQRDHFEYAGGAGGWMDGLGYPFCRGRIFAVTEQDYGQYDDTQEVFWATGAALFIRAELFHAAGGFDEDYFAHYEEIDLCWRLKRAGYHIMACPTSVVYHVGGGTLSYQTPFKTYLNFRNTLYTILKNEPAGRLLWLFPARLVLDGLAGLLFLTQGKFQHISSILRAHWSFYLNFGRALRKRRLTKERLENIRIEPEPNTAGRYKGSIVWQYYARGIRSFDQL